MGRGPIYLEGFHLWGGVPFMGGFYCTEGHLCLLRGVPKLGGGP